MNINEQVIDGYINIIHDYNIVMFSKETCSYCTKSCSLLDGLNYTYKNIDITKVIDPPLLKEKLITLTNQKTVPNIFINGVHIGGYTELKNLYDTNKLQILQKQKPLQYICNKCGDKYNTYPILNNINHCNCINTINKYI